MADTSQPTAASQPPGPAHGAAWYALHPQADRLNAYAAGRVDQWRHDEAEIERMRTEIASLRLALDGRTFDANDAESPA